MTYDCEMHERAAQPAMVIRARTPVEGLPAVLGEAFGAIMGHLGRHGQMPVGPPFVGYYNLDMSDLEVEIGFPTAVPVAGEGRLETGEIPAGMMASVLHAGPYDQVGPAYEALTTWVAEQGYRPTGVAYEEYLNDPRENPGEPALTRVMFPCEPAGS